MERDRIVKCFLRKILNREVVCEAGKKVLVNSIVNDIYVEELFSRVTTEAVASCWVSL